MPTFSEQTYRPLSVKLRRAWVAYYKSLGITSRFRLEELSSKKARKGRWPRKIRGEG